MRGFTLSYARRPAAALVPVTIVPDPRDQTAPDGRIAPVTRLTSRFLDAIETGGTPWPSFSEGYRVQLLLDAVRRSHTLGRWVDIVDPGKIENLA
jgi:predicted dehydrogenase